MMSSWLLQESFNSICAASIVVVDVCVETMSNFPHDLKKVIQTITELLLQVLTTPQSAVTHLRAVGAALQVLEVDVDMFMDVVDADLQHWFRIMQSLMNSHSLSVRSIAVDFVVSLLGGTYDLHGNIDALTLIFVSVLPEVIGREIALYSVCGHITKMDDIAKLVWPIRRSIADIGDTNPLDDTRVDPLLAPILTVFCRACQALIDGVFVELRLQNEKISVIGIKVEREPTTRIVFDADEESVYEAAAFFVPETAPMQRLRWLLTLKTLHAAKNQWVEAAECLCLCARTICDSMTYLKLIWRPTRFLLWSDQERSTWLSTIGEESGHPSRGNVEVMMFAEAFLEPPSFLDIQWKSSTTGKLPNPTIIEMCALLTSVVKDAVGCYRKEVGFEKLSHYRLESALKTITSLVERLKLDFSTLRSIKAASRMRHKDEEVALQKVLAMICRFMSESAENQHYIHENDPGYLTRHPCSTVAPQTFYVAIRLYGVKPTRFEESTTIPTFLEWDKLCVCRVPSHIVQNEEGYRSSEEICRYYAKPFLSSLRDDNRGSKVIVRTDSESYEECVDGITYMEVFSVEVLESNSAVSPDLLSKRFFHRKGVATGLETTVAHEFPSSFSRQTALVTTEIVAKTVLVL
jgi:hypothetical protein